MKTLSIKAKLLNCFFAFTLVTGLCVPSIASYAYAEPVTGSVVEGVVQEEDVTAVPDISQDTSITSEDNANSNTLFYVPKNVVETPLSLLI